MISISELLKYLANHREILWCGLIIGITGVALHTVLFRDALLFGEKLLASEFVRDARKQSRTFERSCQIYEKLKHRVWARMLGLLQSLAIVGLSITGLVRL